MKTPIPNEQIKLHKMKYCLHFVFQVYEFIDSLLTLPKAKKEKRFCVFFGCIRFANLIC